MRFFKHFYHSAPSKMFKKIMAVSATVAIAATMSVSAFAADVTVAPTDNAVTVTPTAVENATMYTVMVFSTTADITDAEKLAAATPADATAIYYINQGADVTALVSNMLVKATSETEYLPAGNYVVRIGNDKGSVQNFALESKVEETTKTFTFIWGDVNLDGYVDAGDVSAISQRSIGGTTTFTKDGVSFTIDVNSNGLLWGDVNLDGYVDAGDVSAISQRSIGGTTTFGDYTIEEDATITITE